MEMRYESTLPKYIATFQSVLMGVSDFKTAISFIYSVILQITNKYTKFKKVSADILMLIYCFNSVYCPKILESIN